MKIAIGSTTSESKIRATESVCARAFPRATVIPVPVVSVVPAQPTSDADTIRGAFHRAREARRLADADLGVGIEGGVHQDPWGVWMCAWVCASSYRSGWRPGRCKVRNSEPSWTRCLATGALMRNSGPSVS
ncbi:MAG: DUF84 family protein [Bacillati bacterium ANGP1]|uniref:inosine/xanthosine triphosphatase n=1 Tax=Candidatus Segetimicrobium genomatis TaxID=2569760 RepID=A0A537L8S4_9BACT|nr:MAG: DUF84 family protein [Terrabacteria group bacterium ANGP1]